MSNTSTNSSNNLRIAVNGELLSTSVNLLGIPLLCTTTPPSTPSSSGQPIQADSILLQLPNKLPSLAVVSTASSNRRSFSLIEPSSSSKLKMKNSILKKSSNLNSLISNSNPNCLMASQKNCPRTQRKSRAAATKCKRETS